MTDYCIEEATGQFYRVGVLYVDHALLFPTQPVLTGSSIKHSTETNVKYISKEEYEAQRKIHFSK